MKNRMKICILLVLVISTILSLMVNTNAASGTFDTVNYGGSKPSFHGGATGDSWGVRTATGTRFVLELKNKEVGGNKSHKYYVNYMQENNNLSNSTLWVGSMYYGGSLGDNCYWQGGKYDESGMVAAKQVTNFKNKTTKDISDPPSNTGNWFNDWRKSGDIELTITEEGTKFLAKVIAARAIELGDDATYNQMKSIVDGTYSGRLAVKAEILFNMRTPESATTGYEAINLILTYNEFRKFANDGSTGGGIRAMRGDGKLDEIACKLYEDDIEYSLKNGKVNCVCNFMNGTWSYESSSEKHTIKNSGYTGETLTTDNTQGWNGSGRKVPNLCSICVGDNLYYSLGLRTGNNGTGKTVSSYIKLTNTSKPGNTTGSPYANNVPGKTFMQNINMKVSTPTIFEGWDYVYSEIITPVKEEYSISETWIEWGTGNALKTAENTTKFENETHTFKGDGAYTSATHTYKSSTTTDNTSYHTWNQSKEGKITVSKDYTVVHYFDKKFDTYTVTERYVDKATNKDIGNGTYTKVTNNIAKNAKYNVTILDITNYTYSGESIPEGSSFTISQNKEIIHYYNKNPEKCTVTIKHIDDQLNDYIYYSDGTKAESKFEMLQNTNWPETGTIRGRYALEETMQTSNPVVATFGQKYAGYKLDTENIKVNGTTYTLDTLPAILNVNENKTIEFHYYKEGRLNVGFYLRQKVDGEIEANKFFSRGGYREVTKIGVENSVKIPTVTEINNINAGSYEELSNSAKFVGYRIVYAPTSVEDLVINENTTLNKNKSVGSKIDYKIPQDKSDVYIYLVYEEEKYSVKVEYYLDDKITPVGDWPDIEYVKSGDDFYPEVPQKIVDDAGEEYEFVKREDNRSREAKIPDIDEPTVLKCYYKPVKKLIIHYEDVFTGESIEPHKDVVTNDLTNPVLMTHPDIHEEKVSAEYIFGKRTDGKPNESDPIDLSGSITEVTFKYWRKNPPSGYGMPVVSDPKLSKKEENGSWSSESDKVEVLVGESIKVYIPNDPSAIHDQVELEPEFMGIIPKPAGGWNTEYAKVKYLVCGCDVYYNGEVITAGAPIRIDAALEAVSLMIPEWVMEGSYTIEAIVGSEDKALMNLKYPNEERYNRIHEETAAYNTVEVEVFGKVYDFTITNLVEDDYWAGSLYDVESEYKADLNQSNLNIGVLPIGQGTTSQQNQKYNHGIALGSTFFFNINTLGKKNQAISIKPTFKYVEANSTQVKDVDLYIEVDGKYEKITETDGQVIKTQLNNDYKKEHTNLGFEMSHAFGITGFGDLKTNASYDLVTGGRLHIGKQQRVPYVEYEGLNKYTRQEDKNNVLTSACHWYGEYRLPSSTKVMKAGEKPGIGTEYKDGFIIVLFEIITQDVENAAVHNTNKYLPYEEQFVGNQWENEGGAKPAGNSQKVKMTLTMPRLKVETNGQNVLLEFDKNTYPVAIYDVAVRANGKYEAAGTH